MVSSESGQDRIHREVVGIEMIADGCGGGPGPRPYDLSGRVAVVTGGSGGIGLGIAEALAAAGARVRIWARGAERAAAAVSELVERGLAVDGAQCDVTDEASVVENLHAVVRDLGHLDIMVANAGRGVRQPLLDTTRADWEDVLAVNLTGPFLCFREAARHMIAASVGGSLVALGSIAAIHAAPTMHHYASAKAGLSGLVRALAVELAPFCIRCNLLIPGWTDNLSRTSRSADEPLLAETLASIPAGRWGRPDDLGAAAVYLADPRLSYHTGASVVVDGAYSILPPYLAVRRSRGGEGY
jgi:NAD(P)-dependent dehydrogenase (short-subunit alcohol dehydrogenase family)